MNQPPRLACWLLQRSLAPGEREPIVGDLLEEFADRSAADRDAARRWFWSQTLRSLAPNVRRRWSIRDLTLTETQKGSRMNGLAIDLRFALRLMRRQPLMTAVGFLSLTAGLGLNILLFTLANAVLFRPIPVRAPGELVVLLLQRESGLMHNFSYPDYETLRDGTHLLSGLVAYSQSETTLSGAEVTVPLDGELVSANFFEVLGVRVQAGRALIPADNDAGAPPAVVISDRLWRTRLSTAPLAGQQLTLGGTAFTVVGVAAPVFSGMQVGRASDYWVPLAHAPSRERDALSRPNTSFLTLVGRIGNGSVSAARDELDAILRRAFEARERGVEPMILRPGARGDSMLPQRLASPMLLLLGAGVLVLLVSCLNVANLQLARNEGRRVELAVRAALGARRGQLVRLMAVDALLLSTAAAAAGVAIAIALKDRAASLIALFGRPVELHAPIDVRVVAASVGLAVGAVLVIALASTWQLLRRTPAGGLTDGRTLTASSRAGQRGLVLTQFALSMALITGAVLLVRTLDRLRSTDLGFAAGQIAVIDVSPAMRPMSRVAGLSYYDEVTRRLLASPGVRAAAVAAVMPLDFGGERTTVDVAGYQPGQDEDMELNFLRVTPSYFDTLQIPITQGRAFDERDRDGQPRRIIVNETMARRYWRDGRAVGQFVRIGPGGPFDIEVVGVVPDAHYRMVREEPRPSFYAPMAQWPSPIGVIHVRLDGDPTPHVESLRRLVASVDPGVPVRRASALREQVERNIADERMAGAIGVTLALVALVLAAAGLYATMAFLVGSRTREIGVRVALGARAADVRRMVLRDGVLLVVGGVTAGVVLALWVGHALRHQLYGISPFDPASLASAAVLLGVVALLASWIPARRAAKVDPVMALRDM